MDKIGGKNVRTEPQECLTLCVNRGQVTKENRGSVAKETSQECRSSEKPRRLWSEGINIV